MKIDENAVGQRLDNFLTEHLGLCRSEVQKGILRVGGVAKKPSYKLKLGDVVEFEPPEPSVRKVVAQKIPLDVIYEDDELLIINKPKNMLAHPTSYSCENTLVNALLAHCGENLSDIGGELRRGIVHRLDKNTAGLLMTAKTNAAHEALSEQIKNKTAVRKYLAVALGEFSEDEGTINKPIAKNLGDSVKMYISPDGAPAVTHYNVLERFNGATLVELQLETGRTHQIRVHLSSLNHPVFGDTLYNSGAFQKFSKIKTTGQVLQSYYLAFTHPKTGAKMEFTLPQEAFDKDFTRVLNILRKDF